MDDNGDLLAYYVYDGVGLVTKITPENAYYFYHYDGLGNTVAITDSNGVIVNAYAYSPYGLVGSQETIENSFQYVGRFGVLAEGNGLYFMRARYYDPETGRFINKDPIGYEGGSNNLFTYVAGNPIGLIDPWGLYWEYAQSNGQLTYVDNQTGARTPVATGYSGLGLGRNNIFMQDVRNVGPIPQGTYTIGPQQDITIIRDGRTITLYGAMRLTPNPGTITFGRSGFIIHGGSISKGCPLFERLIRDRIANCGDTTFKVVPFGFGIPTFPTLRRIMP